MKILVSGSRKMASENTYKRLAEVLGKYENYTLLHGGAVGVDALAARYAEAENINTEVIRPDYENHGRYAPLKRNSELVEKADLCIGIYAAGRIRKGGTWDTVQKALKKGIKVIELLPDGTEQVTESKPSLF